MILEEMLLQKLMYFLFCFSIFLEVILVVYLFIFFKMKFVKMEWWCDEFYVKYINSSICGWIMDEKRMVLYIKQLFALFFVFVRSVDDSFDICIIIYMVV